MSKLIVNCVKIMISSAFKRTCSSLCVAPLWLILTLGLPILNLSTKVRSRDISNIHQQFTSHKIILSLATKVRSRDKSFIHRKFTSHKIILSWSTTVVWTIRNKIVSIIFIQMCSCPWRSYSTLTFFSTPSSSRFLQSWI